ncbi:MAG: chemotaxis protein CheW [Alphaproteobacteria bacterium]|nr:chemotaxis protein CheW [Alphaproteobacteria bacterium]
MGRTDQDIGTLLVFSEGKTVCALASNEVQEVVFLPELLHPPGMPSLLEGVMTLDGMAVPVIRLAALLGIQAPAIGVYTPVIVLKDAKAALLVERVEDVFQPVRADLVPAKDGQSFNGCVIAETRHKEKDIYVLSVDRLLLEEEKTRLAEFKALAEERLNRQGLAVS